jgi:hypothetical protein
MLVGYAGSPSRSASSASNSASVFGPKVSKLGAVCLWWAALQLAEVFARKGHKVMVFCNIERQLRWQGISLVPGAAFFQQAAARA